MDYLKYSVLYFVLVTAFYSCGDKKNTNFFEIDKSKIQIEKVQLIPSGNNFRLVLFSNGVHTFKNVNGADSFVYDDNAVKVYYWLYKAAGSSSYTGEYIYYLEKDSSANDLTSTFNQAGYFNSGTNGNGISYQANTGKVNIQEKDGIFEIAFEFFQRGTNKSPEQVAIKGSYKGIVEIIN